MIERYNFRDRVMHWLTAIFYTYCLATGLAFYTPHLFWLALVLGGGPTSRFWHPIIGVLFMAGTIWMYDMWRRDMSITETDKRWLKRTEHYAKNQDELLPLQERFNACVSFFLDGEMAEAHPELAGKPARIELRCAHMPDTRALELLGLIHDQLVFQDIKMEVVVKDAAG